MPRLALAVPARTCVTMAASRSSPPTSGSPSAASTSRPLVRTQDDGDVERAAAEVVDHTQRPTGTCLPNTEVKYDAAATGSGTKRTAGSPARPAAAASIRMRGPPHPAGWVSTV